MRIKRRLTLWLGMLVLLILILASVGLGTIWQLRVEGRNVMRANYNSIEYAQRMMIALDRVAEREQLVHALDAELARQRMNITEPGEAELTERLIAHVDEMRSGTDGQDLRKGIRQDLNGIIELNRQAIMGKAERAEHRAETAFTWISLVGTLCFLIAFTLFFNLPERLSEPIRKLTDGIDRIAAGHYNERVELRSSDEFGHMAERFNAMAAELQQWHSSNLARIMEEKTRAEAVINSLQDASIGLDERGRVLFANQHALDLMDLAPEGIVGLQADEAASTNDLLKVVIDGGHNGPLKIVKDGREQFFTVEHVPILRSGARVGTVIVLRNVTSFEEKDRAKSHFLATITHELKTPLASTDIGLSLLERRSAGEPDPQQQAILGDLRKDHQRLVRIVSELLDLAQVEAGNIRVNPTACALGTLIGEAILAVRTAGQQKDVLFARTAGNDGLKVQADPDKAVWVLVNLLGNAVRHSPHRGIITIDARSAGGRVEVAVSDQGPGVPKPDQARLFQRFSPGSVGEHGSGLGLSIVREFMRAMGGDVEYRPGVNDGATFVLTFAAA